MFYTCVSYIYILYSLPKSQEIIASFLLNLRAFLCIRRVVHEVILAGILQSVILHVPRFRGVVKRVETVSTVTTIMADGLEKTR